MARKRFICTNCGFGGCTLYRDEGWVGTPFNCPDSMVSTWIEAGEENDEHRAACDHYPAYPERDPAS